MGRRLRRGLIFLVPLPILRFLPGLRGQSFGVRDFEIHMELPGPGEVPEKKGGGMHKDKRYKAKEEEEEELDELESSALLLFGCD